MNVMIIDIATLIIAAISLGLLFLNYVQDNTNEKRQKTIIIIEKILLIQNNLNIFLAFPGTRIYKIGPAKVIERYKAYSNILHLKVEIEVLLKNNSFIDENLKNKVLSDIHTISIYCRKSNNTGGKYKNELESLLISLENHIKKIKNNLPTYPFDLVS